MLKPLSRLRLLGDDTPCTLCASEFFGRRGTESKTSTGYLRSSPRLAARFSCFVCGDASTAEIHVRSEFLVSPEISTKKKEEEEKNYQQNNASQYIPAVTERQVEGYTLDSC